MCFVLTINNPIAYFFPLSYLSSKVPKTTHELLVHDIHFWWCKKSLKHVWNTNCAKLKAISDVICATMVKNYGGTFVFG
jgi:hypothetical protein